MSYKKEKGKILENHVCERMKHFGLDIEAEDDLDWRYNRGRSDYRRQALNNIESL